MKHLPITILIFILLYSCNPTLNRQDYSHIPSAFDIQITHSAGTTESQSFLPFLGNIGIINENTEVLVLSTSVEIGKFMPVRPIGTLILKEGEDLKNIIIASPLDSTMQLSTTTNFQEFIAENAGEKQIIQDWFLYQKGLGKTELVAWKDERYALKLVKKALSNQ